MKTFNIFARVGVLLYSLPGFAGGFTECFREALRKNESIKLSESVIAQFHERKNQAQAAFLPSLVASGTFTRQETPDGLTANQIFPRDQTTGRITAQYPLFRGFRDYHELSRQTLLNQSAQRERERVILDLYVQMANVFFQREGLRREQRHLEEEKKLQKSRLDELIKFERLGRARATERLSQESLLQNLLADSSALEKSLSDATLLLQSVTGSDQKSCLGDHESGSMPMLQSLEDYLKEYSHRPDLRMLEAQRDAEQERLLGVKAGHLPSLDLFGNYYLKRPGLLKGVRWDVQLALTIPIFQGGLVQSQTQDALISVQSLDLQREQFLRQARVEITQIYSGLQALKKQESHLDQAFELALRAEKEGEKDFARGRLTAIERLTLQSQKWSFRRGLDRVRAQMESDWHRLHARAYSTEVQKIVMGEKPL